MNSKIVFYLYLFVIIIMFLGGGFYASLNEFMPYHAKAIGLAWSELDVNMQWLLLAFINSSGLLLLLNSIFMFILLKFSVSRGDKWAAITITVLGSAVLSVPMLAAINLGYKTPANPPWFLILPLIFILWLAYYLFNKQNQS